MLVRRGESRRLLLIMRLKKSRRPVQDVAEISKWVLKKFESF